MRCQQDCIRSFLHRMDRFLHRYIQRSKRGVGAFAYAAERRKRLWGRKGSVLKVGLFFSPSATSRLTTRNNFTNNQTLLRFRIMNFPFALNDDAAAQEELNQLLASLPPLFPGENISTSSDGWETALLVEGTSSPDCIAAFSALDLTVPPPPPAKAPVPIAPAVFLPPAENISMERRYRVLPNLYSIIRNISHTLSSWFSFFHHHEFLTTNYLIFSDSNVLMMHPLVLPQRKPIKLWHRIFAE
jgi:hypothetical protein